MVPFPSFCPDVTHSILESAEVYLLFYGKCYFNKRLGYKILIKKILKHLNQN